MNQVRPVMKRVCAIIGDETVNPNNTDKCHPGLWLDKFARPGKQEIQRAEIKKVCTLSAQSAEKEKGLLSDARTQREKTLSALGADRWTFTAQTTGPFTLHLSRASALENAGICLHPVYGFAYIPGTAVKGMAHAFAETVWFPGQYKAKDDGSPEPLNAEERQKAIDAWRKIEAIFGWAPGSDKEKRWKPKEVPKQDNSSSGAIVFHDAWPLKWPKLICDIVNNHHPKYYSGENNEPPGDWENPNPVYFLAVAPDTEFDFPLSLRPAAALNNSQEEELKNSDSSSSIQLACQWLLGALEHRGAGAKTNTGYGRFQLSESKVLRQYPTSKEDVKTIWEKATDKTTGHLCEETFTLELITPAFLAGANQEAEDCDLRPSTLRGHLHWWWRTMHAGYLDVATLKELEDAIWGSTKKGGAVAIEITPKTQKIERSQFDKKKLPKVHDLKCPPQGRKTTQGLSYLSFGMDDNKNDENGQKVRVQRYYLEPLNQWKVVFIVRSVVKEKRSIPARIVAQEAVSALYLLCVYGGIGAKSRKGFGSVALPKELSSWTLETCRESALKFRQSLGIDTPFDEKRVYSPSIGELLERKICTPWKNVWDALDQLGFSYQAFAQSKEHQLEKKALGLPRRIGNPVRGKFNPTGPVKSLGPDARYSSPFFFHLDLNVDKTYSIRVTAFPSSFLPDIDSSRAMLKELLDHLDKDLRRRTVRKQA